jgi:hypothetical protein
MKRLKDTGIWQESWFMSLSLDAKLAWFFIDDNCDNAGVWSPNFDLMRFCTKRDIGAAVQDEFGDRMEVLPSGKWWMHDFITTQCGELSVKCPPHVAVIATLKKHGIAVPNSYIMIAGETPLRKPRHAPKPPEDKEPLFNQHKHAPAPVAKPKVERERDLCFEALCELQGSDYKRVTSSERGKLNAALKEIRATLPDVTAQIIGKAAIAYRRKYRDAALTATAIASHWSELTAGMDFTDEAKARAALRAELSTAQRELDPFLIDGTCTVRDDLTEVERLKALRLYDAVDNLKRELGFLQ